ncbi:DUF6302 family protein [Streptomyces somaliensis]|uniref:DUF6302 family protein n=1 Tax=Streptomyces somaliensis TaxID=78355 RepID=UPI003F75536D
MLTAATTLPRHPAVSLRPAAEAYDYEYFRSRLAEPALLADAVAVRVYRAPLLAAPVGGPRRGGYMSFDLLTHTVATHVLLAEQPGFPNLRIRWSLYRDTCHTVEWGDRAPPPVGGRRGLRTLLRLQRSSDSRLHRAAPPVHPLRPCPNRVPPRHRSSPKRAQLPTREDEHHVCAQPAVPHG